MACTTKKPQGQCTQGTATDHVRALPPCPCTDDPPHRVKVDGKRSQPIMRHIGLGKSLPLICEKQPRLNYKRRVYSAYMKGAPRVPAWVIGEAVPLDPTGHLLH